MRIRCPSCSATYEVSDALVDPPRTVRCAKCAHDWMATPVGDDDELEEAASADAGAPPFVPYEGEIPPKSWEPVVDRSPDPVQEIGVVKGGTRSAIDRLSDPSGHTAAARRRDRLLTIAWAASFAGLAVLGVTGYTERDMLMRQWPASKRVYATLGLAPQEWNGPPVKVPVEPGTR